MKSLFLAVLLVAVASAATINEEIVDDPNLLETSEEFDLSDDPDVSNDPDVADMTDVADVTEVPVSEVTTPSVDATTCCSVGARSGRLLVRSSHVRHGKPNVTYIQNITFRTGTRRITAIQITHIGPMQGSRASIVSGGLNRNHVTIRLQSARGRGYNFRILIYGR
uniref:SFRICE_010610 n=1 Tax=Spodoptera frugiperda TaxID=7108 RepID=A0A2H1VK77_SPOFR